MDKVQTNTSESIDLSLTEKIETNQEKHIYTAIESKLIETPKPKMSIEEKTNILNQLKSHDLSDATRNALIKMLSE